ncbi:hypothetical protein KKH65_05735, partial [bacterium]|nr:hypothetical protein [bacterium]
MKKKLGRTRKKKEGTEKRISQKIAFWLTDSRFYLVIIIAVFIFHAYHFRFFIMDDAFTSFRYAQNLVDGHGIVYNPGERVEGYTNFLWTLIITCFMKAGFQPEGLSQVLGVISGVIGIVLTFLLSSKIAPKDKLLNLLACLFLSANTCYAVWSIAGMETTFFTAFILGGATRYIFELQNKERIPFSSVIFGIASLIRPEGLLFFGVTLIHQITLLLLKKGSPKNIFLSIGLF